MEIEGPARGTYMLMHVYIWPLRYGVFLWWAISADIVGMVIHETD